MKILYLPHFFPPMHNSGTENYTLAIAKGFRDCGHEVRVLCAGDWDQGPRYWNGTRDEEYQGLHVQRININWRKATDPNRVLYQSPQIGQYLGEYLREFQPDIVHVTSCYSLSASVIEAAHAAGLPIVVTLTDFWFLCARLQLVRGDGTLCDGQVEPVQCIRCKMANTILLKLTGLGPLKALQAPFLRWVSRTTFLSKQRGFVGLALDMAHRRAYLKSTLALADCVIAPSNALKSFFDLNGWQMPVRVQPYGHDLSWLGAHGVLPKTPSKTVRFGYMGQIMRQKGVHLLIQAFQKLPRDLPAELHIYGKLLDTPYVQELRESAASDPRIHLEGYVNRDRLAEVFQNLDCLVQSSLWHENNPLVIQEAYAAGTPVIASDGKGTAEFVQDGVTGLLFRRGDVEDMAARIRQVIEQPALLDGFRRNLPQVKTKEQEVGELNAIYQQLAGSKR